MSLLATLLLAAPQATACPEWSTEFTPPGADGLTDTQVVFDDGSGPALYVGGGFQEVGGVSAPRVARYRLGNWESLGAGLSSIVETLCVFDDGSGPALYAGGYFLSSGVTPMSYLARWTGSAWVALPSTVNGPVAALAVWDDGQGSKLYASGEFTAAGGQPANRMAAFDGTGWRALGAGTQNGLNGTAYDLLPFDDGSGPALYATGNFTLAGGAIAGSLARWNGASWSTLGSGLNDGGNALALFDDGTGTRLYVAGRFTHANGVAAAKIARWNGSNFEAVGGGISGGQGVYGLSTWNDGSGTKLYVAGQFTGAGGVPASNVAAWNGASWSALAAGTSCYASSFASYDDGSGEQLYVGGCVISAGAGVPTRYFARWSGSDWSPVGSATWINGGSVLALIEHDDGNGPALYVGGAFNYVGSLPARNVARRRNGQWENVGNIQLGGILHDWAALGTDLYAAASYIEPQTGTIWYCARWDGANWSNVGGILAQPGFVEVVEAYDDGAGPALFAAGRFAYADSVLVNSIAKRTASGWVPLSGGLRTAFGAAGDVNAMAVFDAGNGPELYVAGDFDTAGGLPIPMIAKWNGTNWSSVGAGLFGAAGASVSALTVHTDASGTRLYAGGSFLGSPGVDCVYLAAWNGITWSIVGNGTSLPVRALGSFDDGSGLGRSLLVGGSSQMVCDGLPVNGVGAWDGLSWRALGNGLQFGSALAFAEARSLEHPGRDVYIGGDFVSSGGDLSGPLNRWKGCNATGRELCFGDGSGTPCPCGNASVTGAREGCVHSLGTAGKLRASGVPSLTSDTLVLSGSQMPNGSALYFQGTARVNGGAGAVFGDGLRCAGGAVLRLRSQNNVGGASQYPDTGNASIHVQGAVFTPGLRVYQVRFRNAADFCTSAPFNLTNAVEIVWSL